SCVGSDVKITKLVTYSFSAKPVSGCCWPIRDGALLTSIYIFPSRKMLCCSAQDGIRFQSGARCCRTIFIAYWAARLCTRQRSLCRSGGTGPVTVKLGISCGPLSSCAPRFLCGGYVRHPLVEVRPGQRAPSWIHLHFVPCSGFHVAHVLDTGWIPYFV